MEEGGKAGRRRRREEGGRREEEIVSDNGANLAQIIDHGANFVPN